MITIAINSILEIAKTLPGAVAGIKAMTSARHNKLIALFEKCAVIAGEIAEKICAGDTNQTGKCSRLSTCASEIVKETRDRLDPEVAASMKIHFAALNDKALIMAILDAKERQGKL